MLVTRKSPFTGKEHTLEIPVTQSQLDKWQSGELIQVAMPDLTPSQREFVKTGITEDEWNDTFGEEE